MPSRIRTEDLPLSVLELCRTLSRHGFRGWVVGGSLRDLARGKPPTDWDLATDARPEQVQSIFPRVIPTGIQHGTVTVRHRGESFEVTTLRGEGQYTDGRHPDDVQYVTDIREDLSRRDFTINALAYDPVAERLEDPFDGIVDLERGLIRAVGAPELRFGEDGLRVLRAARFAATLEFELESATEAAIRPTLDTFRKVSAERVREEWLKALKARVPSRAFDVMRRTGILAITYPELAELPERTWRAACSAIDAARPDQALRLAALLWPLRASRVGVAAWLTRYRFSNLERDVVLRLLVCAVSTEPVDGDADVRRFAARASRAAFDDVAELGVLVTSAYEGVDSAAAEAARELQRRLAELVGPTTPLTARDLVLGGRELMEALSVPPGPRIGRLLEVLLDKALDDPSINSRERLLEVARALVKEE